MGYPSRQGISTFKGHIDHVTCVAFSPNGRFVMSGSLDKTIVMWNIDRSSD